MVAAAAQVQSHAVEQRAVQLGVFREQAGIVGRKTAQGLLDLLPHRSLRVVQRADIHKHQDLIRALHEQRAVLLRFGRSARHHHPGVTLKRVNAARVSLGEPVAVRQPGISRRALDVGNVLLEDLVRALVDVGIGIEFITGFPRYQRQPAVECRRRPRQQQHRHARRAGHEQAALERAALSGPVDHRLAGLEIHRAGVIADLAFRLSLNRQIEGGNEVVRVHEPVLPREVELQLAGLLVKPPVDQPPDLEQARRLVERHDRRPHRQEQPLVRKDDPFLQRATQSIGADRAVAAQEPFFPRLRRLGADKSPFRNRQALGGCEASCCQRQECKQDESFHNSCSPSFMVEVGAGSMAIGSQRMKESTNGGWGAIHEFSHSLIPSFVGVIPT